MGFLEIFMIGLGLSADAFAVSVSKGFELKKMNWKVATIVGAYFRNISSWYDYFGF